MDVRELMFYWRPPVMEPHVLPIDQSPSPLLIFYGALLQLLLFRYPRPKLLL